GGLQRVLGHVGVEREGTLAEDQELQLPQEPGSLDVEAELARGEMGQVAVLIRHHEGLVVLQDELRELGQARGQGVVVGADEKVAWALRCRAAAARVSSRRYTVS